MFFIDGVVTSLDETKFRQGHGSGHADPLTGPHNREKYCAKGRYVFNWGGWAGASEGRVISKIFTNWGGPNLFCSKLGEGHTFFSKEEDYSISLLFKSTLLFYLPSL